MRALTAGAVIALVLLVGAWAGPVLAQVPPSPTMCEAGSQCPTSTPDLFSSPIPVPTATAMPAPTSTASTRGSGGGSGILGAIGGLLGGFNPISWIDNVITAAVRPVFEAWGAVVFQTPDLIDNNAVRTMWLTLLALCDACLVLIVLIAAHRVTWGNVMAQEGVKKNLSRIFLGALGAHLNLLLLVPAAAIANALTLVLLQVGGDNLQVRVTSLIPIVVGGATNPLMTLLAAAAVVAAILVVFWSLVRWVVFAMVTSLGPPANYALAVGQDDLFRAWWRCELILLFVPVLQVVCYDLATWLFFGIDTILPRGSDLISAMGVLVLMWCLYHIPKVALRMAAAPLMGAADAAKGKAKMALGLAAVGIGAATGMGLGLGARGFSLHGILRGLAGRAGRRHSAERRAAEARARRRPRPGSHHREPPIHVESERIS